MRRVLVTCAVLALLALGVTPASANSDPHRTFLPSGSWDWDGACAFSVHVDTLVDNEYLSVSTRSDGSTIYRATGTFKLRISNAGNGRWLDVNSSGPITNIVAPDGITVKGVLEGRSIAYGWNLTDFGFPSNLVIKSGLFRWTQVSADNWAGGRITSVSKMPHVDMDVCAALS